MNPSASSCDDIDEELALFPAPPPVQYQDPDQHVIQFSSGVGSALAALTIAEHVGHQG
jgi:DNA-binding transcriptional MocR family regulator